MTELGHNNPPSEYDIILEAVNDLVEEAKGWADGENVQDEAQEKGVSDLINLLRKQKTAVTKWHKKEKEPYLIAGKAVDAKKNDVAKKIDLATDALKNCLAPYLAEKERQRIAEIERQRKEAQEAERKAREAIEAARKENDLEATVERENAIQAAKQAQAQVNKTVKEKANAKSSFGRALTTREDYEVDLMSVEDAFEYFKNNPKVHDLLSSLALAEARQTKGKHIPGFIVSSKKVVV
jgi:hypothetical protein